MRGKAHRRFVFLAIVLLVPGASAYAALIPWDPLTTDSWITFSPSDPKMTLHTANGGDYPVGFDQADGSNRARGMNALRFSFGGNTTGHLVSDALSGSFAVTNAGNARTFSDLVLLVALDAPSLPADFTMSLGVSGDPLSVYSFNRSTDFALAERAACGAGRPSGYYSATTPAGEDIAYGFATGRITLFAAPAVNLAPSGGTVTFDYTFTNLPGRAVFSVYGLDASVGWIYHTNRGVLDNAQKSSPVSTFEVLPEPGTLALMGLGLAACRWRSRRRVHPTA